jgi:hypothetical protein
VLAIVVLALLACKSRGDDGDTRPLPVPDVAASAEVVSEPTPAPPNAQPAPPPAPGETPPPAAQPSEAATPTPITPPPTAASQQSAAVAPTPASDTITPAIANELGRLNVSTSDEGLAKLGRTRHQLLELAGRLASSANTLGVVLNHPRVFAAFTDRADMKKACRDRRSLEPVLAWALRHRTAALVVANEAAVDAVVGSKVTKTLLGCSAFKALNESDRFLSALVAEDPKVKRVIEHDNFQKAAKKLKIKLPK